MRYMSDVWCVLGFLSIRSEFPTDDLRKCQVSQRELQVQSRSSFQNYVAISYFSSSLYVNINSINHSRCYITIMNSEYCLQVSIITLPSIRYDFKHHIYCIIFYPRSFVIFLMIPNCDIKIII